MLQIDNKILELTNLAEENLKDNFKNIDKVCEKNTLKILNALTNNQVAYSDFAEVNGYGFFDPARDKLEKVFAEVLGAESCLVRPQIMSGTNAIYLTLSALLHTGEHILSISGEPYDPLQEIIGIRGNSKLSLKNNGIKYSQIDLVNNNFNIKEIEKFIAINKVNLIAIQRSCGYTSRKGLSINQIEEVCKKIKKLDSSIIIFCDNCYGELAEEKEPTEVGVDIIAGSLMHNLGGGIATSGGYIAGKEDLVEMVAERLTSPGIAKYLGADYNQKMKYFKGLFMAPTTVANALKIGTLTAFLAEQLGFENVVPSSKEKRSDIVQTFDLKTKENLIKFCEGLQASSPIDSFYTPIPCEMPAYPHDEIMSAGTFAQGSTIELTCDAPVVMPYKVFLQGGLTYASGKISIMSAFSNLIKK